MGKGILCISFLHDSVQYIEVDRKRAGFFPKTSHTATTSEELMTACNRADEIFINSSFPSAVYEWGEFPKVKKRYLQSLVNRDAQEKHGLTSTVDVRFRETKVYKEQGVAKSQVAYVAIEKEEISSIREKLKHHFKKVNSISPLSVAIGAVISQTEKPEANFAFVWVGEENAIISINTADGQVKLARSVPLSMPKGELPDDHDTIFASFSQEIDRELAMTNTFFKQSFRESVPDNFYLLGNPHLEAALEKYPLSSQVENMHFGFSQPPVQGMSSDQISENIHLLGSIFTPKEMSFVPSEEYFERQADLALRISFGFIAVLVVLAGFWGVQLQASKANSQEVYDSLVQEKHILDQEINTFRVTLDSLKPIKARKDLYESLYLNQPKWNAILNELAVKLPPEVVVGRFQVAPAGKKWNGNLYGEIRADNWQKGLNIIRDFKDTLQSSAFFEVDKVNYSRGQIDKLPRAAYSFHFTLQLTPGGKTE